MMAPGGCLADEPPFPDPQPSPAHIPAPRPPHPAPIDSSLSEVLNRTVERELVGQTFLEAIFELQQQLGVKIRVQAPGDMGFSMPVQGPFQGRSLREVLTGLGTRAGEGRFTPVLSGSTAEILIEFRPIPDDAFVEPPTTFPKPNRPPSQYDGTRGIRSDMPGDSGATSKGHRPDLPPDLVPPGDEDR